MSRRVVRAPRVACTFCGVPGGVTVWRLRVVCVRCQLSPVDAEWLRLDQDADHERAMYEADVVQERTLEAAGMEPRR